jgi:hypothetical protein
MDYQALQQLLEQADDPHFAEHPAGWNFHQAEVRFTQLAEVFIQQIGHRCSYNTSIQDASFHGQLVLPRALLTEDYIASLRVSNFGNLATVYDDDSVVAPEALATMRDVLGAFGYIYVPSGILMLRYTGNNPAISRSRSWDYRYFDYL